MDRSRLARLLGMTGSAYDGEVVNAARLAHQMLRQANLGWDEVLIGPGIAVDAARQLAAENEMLSAEITQLRRRLAQLGGNLPDSWAPPCNSTEQIETALRWTAVLTDWERGFVTSIAGRRQLSEKQRGRLDELTRKIETIARSRGLV
jgi:hypothetical protein